MNTITTKRGDQFNWTFTLPAGTWTDLEAGCHMVHRKTGTRHEFTPIVTVGSTTTIQLLEQSTTTEDWVVGDWDADIRIKRDPAIYGTYSTAKFSVRVEEPVTAQLP